MPRPGFGSRRAFRSTAPADRPETILPDLGPHETVDPQPGSPVRSDSRRPPDRVRAAVDPAGVGVVVVICDDRPVVLGRRFRELYPGAEVTVLSDGRRPPANDLPFAVVHFRKDRGIPRALAALPPADLIVDLRARRPADVRAAFRKAFLALADGGRYVVRATRGDGDDLLAEVRELVDRQSLPTSEQRERSTPVELGLVHALAGATVDDGLLVLRKSGEHVLKLGADATRAALAARGAPQRVIARVEPERRTSASSIWSSDPGLGAERLGGTVDVSELVCTVYEQVLCAPRQVAVVERLLLPTSYFLPGRSSRRTRGMRYYGSDFSALLEPDAEPEDLPGTYYHLDNQIAGHYGHVITHDLSKLWAWDTALAEYPDLKVLVSPYVGTQDAPSYTYELLEAYGIGRDRIQVITGPVRVERLITATQGFQQPAFLSPVVAEVWARVVRGLLPRAGNDPLPERVFVSRRAASRRRCLNAAEVERRFEDAGFVIIYPEELSMPDQARLFSSVPVVAGYAGSGLINTVFSADPATRIVLASKTYWATNEYHIAALYGGDLHYFWCDSVLGDGTPGTTDAAFHSDFVFDVERDGPALDELLASLDQPDRTQGRRGSPVG